MPKKWFVNHMVHFACKSRSRDNRFGPREKQKDNQTKGLENRK